MRRRCPAHSFAETSQETGLSDPLPAGCAEAAFSGDDTEPDA
jgi:hypothetical protein